MKIRYFFVSLIIILTIVASINKSNDSKLKKLKDDNVRILNEKILKDRVLESRTNSKLDKDSNILKLNSKAACVYDCKSGRLLYSKNVNEKLPMASTTKIMTCIIALENANLEDEIVISSYAASMPDVQLNAIKGDKFKLKDLLYSLMLESHNDVAVAIAENVVAKKENKKVNIDNIENSKTLVLDFAKLMNKKVKELGLSNTNFVTPNGLDSYKNYTTVWDLAQIASYAIKNKEFIKITNTKNYSFTSINGRNYNISNKNQFLYSYSGAIGCKTGYTSKAGYCFVGAIDKDDYNLVSVVLGCGWPPHKTYKWQDTKKLMDYGVDNYSSTEIVIDNKVFKNKKIVVDNGYNKEYIMPNINEKITLLLEKNEKVKVKVKMINKLVAPVKKNQVVGYVKVYIDDDEYKMYDIKANKQINRITYVEKFTELLNFFLLNTIDNICN